MQSLRLKHHAEPPSDNYTKQNGLIGIANPFFATRVQKRVGLQLSEGGSGESKIS